MTWKHNMTKIVETLGTMTNPDRIAMSSAFKSEKSPFYNFSIRIDVDDIREYSFTDRDSRNYEASANWSPQRKVKTTQNGLHKKIVR